ncbi:MAG: hypothetical protein E7450_01070 [Ruminococcaceae bacterium]|nr:hypothetical protein [Oscillospiraceae bacterium]
MEVSKLKNIVIVILVLLNLFLLILSGGRRVQDVRNREQARHAAVEVIKNGGVKLDEQIVPAKMELAPRTAERDLKAELLQARALLGDEVDMQAKGGEVYRYTGDAGWLQVHSTGQYSAHLTGEPPLAENERAQERAVALLARMDVESRVVESRREDGQEVILLQQTLDGAPLLDCQATVTYTQQGEWSVSGGRRLLGQAEQTGGDPITVATALMRLYNGLNDMGDVYNAITGITQAYSISSEGTGTMRLTPVWQVETDTGTYRLDTLTGGLTRTGDPARQATEPVE